MAFGPSRPDQSLSADDTLDAIKNTPGVTTADLACLGETLRVEADDILSEYRPLVDHRDSLFLSVSIRELQSFAIVYGVLSRWDISIKKPDATLENVIKVAHARGRRKDLRRAAVRWLVGR